MKKEEIIQAILEDLKVVEPQNYGLMTSNRRIITSTFTSKANKIITKFIHDNSNMPIVAYIKEPLAETDYFLYIFKISMEVFLVCVSNKDQAFISSIFKELARKYGYLLFKTFKPKRAFRLPTTHVVREYSEKEPLKLIEKLMLYEELKISRKDLTKAMLNHVKELKHPWPIKKKRKIQS
ncbi:MAG: hypothetical protein ACXQS8_07210 [Candidatus Helarchaeales archaeon]